MLPTQSPVIDVRTLEPRERHVQIFGQFDALRAGEAIRCRCATNWNPVRRARSSGPICSRGQTSGAC